MKKIFLTIAVDDLLVHCIMRSSNMNINNVKHILSASALMRCNGSEYLSDNLPIELSDIEEYKENVYYGELGMLHLEDIIPLDTYTKGYYSNLIKGVEIYKEADASLPVSWDNYTSIHPLDEDVQYGIEIVKNLLDKCNCRDLYTPIEFLYKLISYNDKISCNLGLSSFPIDENHFNKVGSLSYSCVTALEELILIHKVRLGVKLFQLLPIAPTEVKTTLFSYSDYINNTISKSFDD